MKRRAFIGSLSVAGIATRSLGAKKARPNVLFIAVDDLRPALGCYGVSQARTPNLDAFAQAGRLFQQHYVQVPTCGASRYALMTGTLPREKSALNNHAAIKGTTALPPGASDAARSMPELFRKNGYKTVCIGKLSHMPGGKVFNYDGTGDGHDELPDAWDEYLTPYGDWKYGHGSFFGYAGGRHREDKSGYKPYCEFPDVGDDGLPDGLLADAAIKRLKTFGDSGKPFFMGLGFYKPHLPFVCPKKYRDLYDGVAFPSPHGMQQGDTQHWHKSGEFYKYTTNRPFDTPAKGETLAESDAQEARRAYFACVSYIDAQVGKVLRTLREAGLDKNTIVVLWGDHGWHLGDNNIWGKHSPLEKALRSAFIVHAPGMQAPGTPTESLAATIDIYPTLVDLCGIENRKTAKPLDGVSLRPVLDNPMVQARDAALSFWRSSTSMTSNNFRLILTADKKGNYSYELYDHRTDPGELENIAGNNPERVSRLMETLKKHYPQITVK